jgi:hypothetical protein
MDLHTPALAALAFGGGGDSFGFIRNLAIADDDAQVLHGCDVVEGIAVHDDHIGQFSRLQSS